jgi:hypothetical protein
MYKTECDGKLPLLNQALSLRDKPNAVLLSHDIKGSSANIGAEGTHHTQYFHPRAEWRVDIHTVPLLLATRRLGPLCGLHLTKQTTFHKTPVTLITYIHNPSYPASKRADRIAV